MPRRGENIHKRKDGRWEARYKKGVNVDGSARYGSVYARTYLEVKEKQRQAISAQRSESSVDRRDLKLSAVIEMWLEDNRMRLKESTQYRYRYLIERHIAPVIGEMSIGRITSSSINSFLMTKLESGRLDRPGKLSSSYVRSMMVILKAVMKYASDHQLCKPMIGTVNRPPTARTVLHVLDSKDQKRLVEYCVQTESEITTGILISLFAGLRIGEICALSWNDVDLEGRILHIRHTLTRAGNKKRIMLGSPKTHSAYRDIPICPDLLAVLKARYPFRRSEFVTSGSDSYIDPRTYEYRFHRVLQDSAVSDVNYHVLRHTFATRCVESGVDIKSLSEMLGHSDAATTLNIYVHSSMERKRQQIDKLTFRQK